VNVQPAHSAFVTQGDPAGTTLVGESTFEPPLDMDDSNPSSVHGDDNDQPQHFDDIASHMGSTSTETYDGVPDLDERPASVGLESQSESQWQSHDPPMFDVLSFEQPSYDQEPSFEGQPASEYRPALDHPLVFYAQPMFGSQPVSPHQQLSNHQPPFQDQVLHQSSRPSGPVHDAANNRGGILQLHIAHGTPPNVPIWQDGIYVPGQGLIPLQEDESVFTNRHESLHLYPTTTSLPALDLNAVPEPVSPLPTLSVEDHSGQGPGSMVESSAAISSEQTAFNSHVSAIEEQTFDPDRAQCNECTVYFVGDKKKQEMLYVQPPYT
jgi:hypothetical protein